MIDQGWWFVPNPLNKFTVSPRNNPKFNADGSLTLYFQNESPGKDKEANWLPAPKGDFIPMLRMYWPKETVALDPQRHMEAAGGGQGQLTRSAGASAPALRLLPVAACRAEDQAAVDPLVGGRQVAAAGDCEWLHEV